MKNTNTIMQEANELLDRLNRSCTLSGWYKGRYCFMWLRPTRWAYNVDNLNELADLLAETKVLRPRAPHYLDLLRALRDLIKAEATDSTVDGEYIMGHLPLNDNDAKSVRPWMNLVLEHQANL